MEKDDKSWAYGDPEASFGQIVSGEQAHTDPVETGAALDYSLNLKGPQPPGPEQGPQETDKNFKAPSSPTGPSSSPTTVDTVAAPPQEKQQPDLPIFDRVEKARKAGYSWEEIHNEIHAGASRAAAAGYSQEEIDQELGYKEETGFKGFKEAIALAAKQVNGLTPGEQPDPKGFLSWVATGNLHSASGLEGAVRRGDKATDVFSPQNEPPGWFNDPVAQAGYDVGQLAGDTQAMLLGGTIGGQLGGPVGAAAGLMGYPAYLKDIFTKQLLEGSVKTPQEFVQRVWDGVQAGSQAAAVGMVGAGVGEAAGLGLQGSSSPLLAGTVKTGAELSGMAITQAVLTGEWPTVEELTDNFIMLKSMGINVSKAQLARAWAKGWGSVTDAATRAMTDPVFRAKLMRTDPDPPAESATVTTPHEGEYTIPREHPVDGESAPGAHFDGAIKLVLKLEGGYTRDTGGRTMYGISENAHREAWAHGAPTEADAVRIYKHDYWDKMDLDNKDPAIRLNMMDAGVNEGVGKAEEMYRASGGDPERFMELRKAHYDALVRRDPEKYGKYYKGWMNRLKTIAGGKIPEGHVPMTQDPSFHVDDMEPLNTFGAFNDKPLADRETDFEGQRAKLREDGILDPNYGDLDKALKATQGGSPEAVTEAAKWATENGRTDISQALLDHAKSEADAAKDKLKAVAPIEQDTAPAAFIELKRIADEKQKNADALAKLTGLKASPRAQRSLDVGQQPALNSLNHPLIVNAQTADPSVNAVLNSPVTSHVIANAKVNKAHDIPYVAGGSVPLEDPTVYIDRDTPDTLTTKSGKTFSTTEPLIIHENVEQHVMETLVTEHGWDQNRAYAVAHYGFAEPAEHAWYRSQGIDPAEAEEAWQPVIERAFAKKDPNIPGNLYEDPYPHDDPRMAASHPDNEDHPTAKDIELAKRLMDDSIMSLRAGRNTTGAGKRTAVNPLNSSPKTFDEALKTVRQHVVRGDHQATMTEKIAAYAYKGYIELFQDRAPIRWLTEMINAGREAKGMNPLKPTENPLFMRRLADNAPNVLAKVAIDHGMIKFDRDPVTNKLNGRILMTGTDGLAAIMGNKSFAHERERDEFEAYMVSRWALEKAQQGRSTGVPQDAAQMVVDHIESTGKFIPTETLNNIANRIGVTTHWHDLNDPNDPYIQTMQLNGPHYRPRTNSVHMWKQSDAIYEKTYGKGITGEVVHAHELGHAIAYALQKGSGVPAAKMSELADQLAIASHRFKAGLWEKFNTARDKRYFNKDNELIADAMATWVMDPVARNRLSALVDVVPNLEARFGKAPGEDWGNEHMRRFDKLVDFQNRSFQLLRDSGVISHDLFIQAVSDNAARIPGYRAEEDRDAEALANGQIVPERGFGHAGTARPDHTAFNLVRSFRGSEFRLDNIMKGLNREIFTRTKVALENYANQGLVAAAKEIPGVVAQHPSAMVVPTSVADLGKLSMPINPKDLNNPKNPNSPKNPNDLQWMLMGHTMKEDEIPVYFDGKRTIWQFKDVEVPRLLKGLNERQLNILQRTMKPLVKLVRTGIVASPAFAVRLFTYDVPWQFITKPGFRNTLADTFAGLKEAFGKSGPDYERFLLSAAAERVFDGKNQFDYLKEKFKTGGDFAENMTVPNAATDPRKALQLFLNAASMPWRAGTAMTSFVSEAQRVGRFKRGLEAGESDLEAGVMGSEAPFHRAGNSGPATRELNSMQPFVQAHLNSMEKIVRGQFGIGRDIAGDKYDWVNFTVKALAAITLPAMTNWAISHNEDWYKEAPDWQKDNGLLIRVGNHTIYIPFPPLLGALYGGIPKRIASALAGDGHAGDHIGKSIVAALLPPGVGFSSNLAVPLIESYFNKDFFRDAPLEGMSQQGKEAHTRATPFTTGFAKKMAQGIYSLTGGRVNFSPIIIDHLIKGYGGTMSDILVRGSEMALRSAGILTPPPIPYTVEDWPGISSFFERYPSAYSSSTRAMMDRMAEEKQLHGSIMQAITQGDFTTFKELIDNNPIEAVIHRMKLTPKENAILAARGEDSAKFFDYWNEAEGRLDDVDRDNAQTVFQNQKAIDALRLEVAKNEALAQGKKISGSDALQIRDQHYLAITGIAQETMKLMDQSHWK